MDNRMGVLDRMHFLAEPVLACDEIDKLRAKVEQLRRELDELHQQVEQMKADVELLQWALPHCIQARK